MPGLTLHSGVPSWDEGERRLRGIEVGLQIREWKERERVRGRPGDLTMEGQDEKSHWRRRGL